MLDLIRRMALYAPEDGAGAEAGETAPVVEDKGAAAAGEAAESEAAPAEGESEAPPKAKPWFMKALAEDEIKLQGKDQAIAALEKKLADSQALAERLQREKNPNQTQIERVDAQNDNIQAKIDALADQKAFYKETERIKARGDRAFGASFEESLETLRANRAVSDQFVMDIISAEPDSAHELLHRLGKDPEKTRSLVEMPQRQRLVELLRMTMETTNEAGTKATTTTPRTTSRAPSPPPVITSNNKTTKDWRHADTDEEFSKGWEAHQKARKVAR